MTEGRDQPPEPGSHPPITGRATLSPVQEAWGAYVDHATHCSLCRSRDGGKCERAEELYGAYREADGEAFRQLHGEAG
ncbi:hypothetical protein [Streptomyces sp. NPDC050534]|uniref:hypothetical protein n=1 Tax=Streptomyces sp. NPDC050534 TaxID=3365625 RepID=UPI0037A9D9B9